MQICLWSFSLKWDKLQVNVETDSAAHYDLRTWKWDWTHVFLCLIIHLELKEKNLQI